MKKILESIFLLLLIIGIVIFLLIIIMEFISDVSKDYQYAIIGAMGSLIGGTFTLAGVWWTLKNQAKLTFIDKSPKKIRAIDKVKNKIIDMSNSESLYKDLFYPNQSVAYKNFIDDLKIETTEIDGKSYFLVCSLENLYEEFCEHRKEIIEYEKDVNDDFGRPILTTKSFEKLTNSINEFKNKLIAVAEKLEVHGNELTNIFFKYMGNK